MRWWIGLFVVLMACGDDSAPADSGTDVGDRIDAAEDAAGDAAEDAFDAGPLTLEDQLQARGEWPVGYTTIQVTYDRPDDMGTRELELHVWYPAEEVSDGMRPAYPLRRSDIAVTDAPAAEGPFPVLAFSHGHQAIPAAASDLMEQFASHGWLVYSPTHVGNTTIDGPDRVTSIYYLRPHDVSRSLDTLESLDSDHPLAGLVGSPKVVSGHSFGGYTAYAVAGLSYTDMLMDRCAADEISSAFCSELDSESEAIFRAGFGDERFDAVIAMATGDSTLFGEGIGDLDIPLLHMLAEGDGHPPADASGDLYWQNTSGADDLRINMLEGGHNNYTDTCLLVPLRCSETLDAQEALNWVRVYALGWARAVVLGEADVAELLAGDPLFPNMEVTRR